MDHLPGAVSIAADAMGVTTAELGKMMEKGQVMAEDLVPKMAAQLRKLAAPSLVQSLKSLTTQQTRMLNQWIDFKQEIFKGGLDTFLANTFQLVSNLLTALKPVASFLRGMFNGLAQIVGSINIAIAVTLDWLESIGLIKEGTNELADGIDDIAETLGEVASLGAFAIIAGWFVKMLMSVRSIFKVLGALKSKIPAVLGGVEGAAATTGASAGMAMGRMLLSGLTAVLAGFSLGKWAADNNFLGVADFGAKIGSGLYDAVHTPALGYYQNNTNTDATKNIKSAMGLNVPRRSTYQSTGYGAGLSLQQPVTVEVKLKGDVVEQHVSQQIMLSGMNGN